jgi:hypothetical protein
MKKLGSKKKNADSRIGSERIDLKSEEVEVGGMARCA